MASVGSQSLLFRTHAYKHVFLEPKHFFFNSLAFLHTQQSENKGAQGYFLRVLTPGRLPRWRWWSRSHLALHEMWVQSLGGEGPLEEGTATHSSTLAWEVPRTEEPGRLQSMGSQRAGHD